MVSTGLSHVTFIVEDLDKMELILTAVLGARRVYESGKETFSYSQERFFLVGTGDNPTWVAIMEGSRDNSRSYDHVAFHVSEKDLADCERKIVELGLEMLPPRSRVSGEGQSIYFYDFDGHLFELHTGTLEQRLKRYASGR